MKAINNSNSNTSGIVAKENVAEITCQQLETFLLDYLEGNLSSGVTQEFRQHLNSCMLCNAYVGSYLKTMQLSKAACETDGGSICENIPEALVLAILDSRQNQIELC